MIKRLGAVVALVCLLCALGGFLVPLGVAAFLSLSEFGSGGASAGQGGLRELMASLGRLFPALRFTLLQAGLSALIALVLGLPGAFLTARRNFPGRRFLLSLSGVPLCVPPLIIALAFVLFYGRQGYLNRFLMGLFHLKEPPVTFLYSFAGLVIAHGLYNFPVVMRTVGRVWERLGPEQEEAALLLGASPWRIFRTITVPQLRGAMLSSFALIFLYCFFSFVIVLLFGGVGGTTLEVELYHAARGSLDFAYAARIAMVETLAALLIVIAYSFLSLSSSRGSGLLPVPRERRGFRSFPEGALAAGYLLAVALFFVGPLVSIPLRSFFSGTAGAYGSELALSLGPWISLFTRNGFLPALGSTLGISILTMIVATLAALGFALWEDKRLVSWDEGKGLSFFFRSAPMLPLAVSSVIAGFGWLVLVPRGSPILLVIAQSAAAWPFAWIQIRSALDRIPLSVREAAVLLSRDPLDALARVYVPLAWRGILSGAAFAFAISAGDATLPLVLSIGDFENLPLLLFRLVGSYRFAEACACAVILAGLSSFVFFIQDTDTGKGRGS